MSPILQLRRVFSATLTVYLLLLTTACVAPQPRIVLNRPATARHASSAQAKNAARLRCKPPPSASLTAAEKTRLFDDFEAWKDEQRPSGTAVANSLPPPAPTTSRNAPSGCTVTAN